MFHTHSQTHIVHWDTSKVPVWIHLKLNSAILQKWVVVHIKNVNVNS